MIEKMERKDSKKILEDSKLKVTSARLAILDVLVSYHNPISAEQILALVKRKKTNLTTVYRNLERFIEERIVKQTDLRGDSVCYELASHHHHHIVCTKCRYVEEFTLCDISHIEKKILGRSSQFSKIKEHALELFGICKKCARV